MTKKQKLSTGPELPYRVVVSDPKPGSKVRADRKHYDVVGPDGKRMMRWTCPPESKGDMAYEDCERLNAAYKAGVEAGRSQRDARIKELEEELAIAKAKERKRWYSDVAGASIMEGDICETEGQVNP